MKKKFILEVEEGVVVMIRLLIRKIKRALAQAMCEHTWVEISHLSMDKGFMTRICHMCNKCSKVKVTIKQNKS